MNIKTLKEMLAKEKLKTIEFEDYYGNTMFFLKDVDVADIDNGVMRLQLNIKETLCS